MNRSLHYRIALWAVLVGIFLGTEFPKKCGLYRSLVPLVGGPFLLGMLPATYHGVEWKFTKQQLAQANITGQHALVTGANSGIGYALVEGLVDLGAASVTLACRNRHKCTEAVQRLIAEQQKSSKTKLRTLVMDTSSLLSVQKAAHEYVRLMNETGASLDMLFLNAGTAYSNWRDKCVPESDDGIEYVFATNYLGHFLLYQWVEPLLRRSNNMARVVSTSSVVSFLPYSYKVATDLETLNGCSERFVLGLTPINYSYGQSKLAQLLWTKELTRRLGPDSNIYVNAFHPGGVATGIFDKALDQAGASRFFYWLKDWVCREILWSATDGAHTGLFLGLQTEHLQRHAIRGNYYHPQGELVRNALAEDTQLQRDLWEFSESLVQPFLPDTATPAEKVDTPP